MRARIFMSLSLIITVLCVCVCARARIVCSYKHTHHAQTRYYTRHSMGSRFFPSPSCSTSIKYRYSYLHTPFLIRHVIITPHVYTALLHGIIFEQYSLCHYFIEHFYIIDHRAITKVTSDMASHRFNLQTDLNIYGTHWFN